MVLAFNCVPSAAIPGSTSISLKAGLAGYIVPSKLYGIVAAGRPYVAAVEEAYEVAAITRKYECGLLDVGIDAIGAGVGQVMR